MNVTKNLAPLILFLPAFCFSAGNSGTVNFSGKITAPACTIASESIDQSIPFGDVDIYTLMANGNTGITDVVPFYISLQGCSGTTGATATFTGLPALGVTGALAIAGSATNACVVLFDKDASRLPINTTSKVQDLIKGQNQLVFGAAVSG